MIKNRGSAWAALSLLGLLACGRGEQMEGRFQGVVEYDERDLSFEVAGRIVEVKVREGDALTPGTVIARLDDRLARSSLEARTSDARAAEDQLRLLRAGARSEDVQAMRARLESAKASEALAERSAARARSLSDAQAVTRAALDEAETQLERARAERRALEENLRALSSGARSQEVEAASDRLQAARAAADLERERLARHELQAHQVAEVLEVHLEANELAPAGVPVVTVADVVRPHADVFVPQAEIAGIHVGDRMQARVDGVAEEIGGQVELIERRTQFTPRYLFSDSERGHLVVRVRVRLADPSKRLHAGIPIFVRRGEAGHE